MIKKEKERKNIRVNKISKAVCKKKQIGTEALNT
jgi:hypothetical protein